MNVPGQTGLVFAIEVDGPQLLAHRRAIAPGNRAGDLGRAEVDQRIGVSMKLDQLAVAMLED